MVNGSGQRSIIKPFGDRVLIELIGEVREEKTPSGVIIPETAAKVGPLKGRILAVGPGNALGAHHRPMESKIGDIVLIDRHYFGDKMEVNGASQILISEGHILGKIVEE